MDDFETDVLELGEDDLGENREETEAEMGKDDLDLNFKVYDLDTEGDTILGDEGGDG